MSLLINFCIQIYIFASKLYKVLLEHLPKPTWKTLSACLVALGNLQKVFGFSVVTDFMLTMSRFSKVFG